MPLKLGLPPTRAGRWWIAYVSDESGTNEVYVQSFPSSGSKWQISAGGGFQPRWRRDGKELFFMAGPQSGNIPRDVMAVLVDTSSTGVFKAGAPQKLFTVTPVGTSILRNSWDVTPDGQRFLVNSPQTQAGGVPPVTVVLNWLQRQKSP